jgi:hypothetical protein
MKQFNPGDRIIYDSGYGRSPLKGEVLLDEEVHYVSIRLDKPSTLFHDCGGKCEDGHGWHAYREYLTLDKVGTIKKFYEQVLLLDRGEGK